MDVSLERASEVVDQLQQWINERDGLDRVPHANLTYSAYSLSVSIGDECVWTDHEDDLDELTVDLLKTRFLESIESLLPFLGAAKKD